MVSRDHDQTASALGNGQSCEDCGEPATRKTSDGIWLCDGNYDLCCDLYFAETYVEDLEDLLQQQVIP